tara:strand:+ start:2537 stop:4636 length:2100 start_codon:yes stop_codon:yes gene_type:complete
VAYQSEIELRVKVLDKELKDLERKIDKVQSRTKAVNPFAASGASKENKKALDLQQRLMAAEKARLSVDKNRLQLNLDLNQQRIKSINLNTSWYKALQTGKQIQLDINKAVAKEVALRKEATAKRRARRREDLALGVGFPLLFGGGPGAVIGGAAGALAGGGKGGFGLQILGSAIGQQVDAFVQAASQAGVALTSTGGALDLVREKSLFSSAETRELAAKLEEQGDAAGLAKLLTEELVDVIGNTGVEALGNLGAETEETTRLWNELTLQLQALISGPLADFLSIVNQFLGEQGNRARLAALQKDLKGTEAGKQLAAEIERLRPTSQILQQGEIRTIKGVLDPKVVTSLLEKFTPARPPSTSLPVTDKDRRRFALKSGKDKLPDLQIEIGLQERLLALDKQIAQATLDENDKIKSILEKEKIRETLEANINKIKNDGLRPALEAAEIELARIDAAQKIQDIDIKTAQVENDKAKKVQETVKSLENEGALLQAKLDGNETEVALKQKIAEATKDMSAEDAKRVEELIRGNALLTEQNKIADQMKQIYEQIGMSIKTGVVDAISAAVDGTKSLAEVASNTLRNIANQLLNIGVNFALFGAASGTGVGGGLLGGLFRADGGPVKGNSPYIVGERGPELFVPRSSGTVVPNHAMGGATVNVAVDASGSSVEGDADQAGQLGKAIGVAVQQELIKQKRPGGLLAV